MRRTLSLAACALALIAFASTAARADLSKKVQKKLRGHLFIAPSALPQDAADDASQVKALEKAGVSKLGHTQRNGNAVWSFHFLAFMSRKPGVSKVALDFYLDDKKKEFVAEKRLMGIDPGLTLLASQVDISEDDGLAVGRRYVVKLEAQIKGKDVVLAHTTLVTQ